MTKQVGTVGTGTTGSKQAPQIVPLRTTGPSAREPAPKGPTAARWFIGAGVMLVAAAAVGVWRSVSCRSSVAYVTMPITIGPIARSVSATGAVNPELTIIVGTYVSGVIQELSCDYNTQVKRGQICAKIDPRPYQSIVDQGKANLAVAKAQLEKDKASLTYAGANLERLATLVKTSAVSRDAYDNAKSAYD
jgi:HlyD family secretion protein